MKEWMAMGAVCGLWAPLLVYGQEPRGITDLITPPAVEQGAPAGSYALSGFERVSLYSGKLHFALPLLSVGGRGETGYSMMLPLDRGWQVRPYNDVNGNVNFFAVTALTVGTHWWSDRPVPLFSPGVVVSRRSGSGLEECAGSSGTYWYRSVLTRLTFIGADGSETELVDEPSGGTAGMYGNCDINETRKLRPGPFVSRDGSAMTFVPATDKQVEDVRDPSPGLDLGLVTGTLYFRDGRRFQVENGTVTAIHDRNGNKVTLVYNAIGQLVSVTDALGRVVTIAYDFETESFLISWSRTGAPGGKRTIKVQCGQMETALGPGVSIQSYSDVFAQFGGSSLPINPQVVKSVC